MTVNAAKNNFIQKLTVSPNAISTNTASYAVSGNDIVVSGNGVQKVENYTDYAVPMNSKNGVISLDLSAIMDINSTLAGSDLKIYVALADDKTKVDTPATINQSGTVKVTYDGAEISIKENSKS